MADDSDSWSMVEAEDEASRDRLASALGQAESTLAQAQDTDLSASAGNDSPPTPAVLEAVADTSPEQSWSLASGLSPTAAASESVSSTSLSHNAPAEASSSAVASKASTHSVQQSDGQNTTEHIPLPSLSGSDLSSTLIVTDALVSPDPLPELQTNLGENDSFDNDESMSEQSSGTAVMVGHPCSDEEDTAERRWRLAEQRGNDIRRASAPPCPKAMGTEGYLKVVVAGESGLGKTTFIENLKSAFQPDSPSSTRSPVGLGTAADTYATFEHSPEQLCTEVTLENGSSKFHYFLQDTPGQVYGQTKVRIADFITAQNERYLAWEQSPHRSVPMSAGDDHRVDACLFFLNPNHLKDAEVADMVQLSELVPVVPMIAKADIFTPSELSAFRLHVRQRLAEEEERLGRAVMWRAAESEEQEEDQGCRQPPFAVIASSHSDLAVGRFWPVRSYPWGKCEAFSSTNSDLASLKRLLFEEGFAALKQATEARYYRYRASRLSHDAGAVLGQQQVGQHAMAAESGGEEDSQWGGAADSDASSETSDMPEIMAGDPAEAAAADLYGESGQRQGGRRSWWMLGFLLAGVMCTVGCMLGNNIQQLKADNRGLRKELAIKEQAVLNGGAYLPPSQPDTQEPLKGKDRPRHKVNAKGSMDQSSSKSPAGFVEGDCTVLMSPWRHTLLAKHNHTRRPKQSAAAEQATEATTVSVQEITNDTVASAPSNATSKQWRLTPVTPSEKRVDQVTTSLAEYAPTTIKAASDSALQSVTQAAQLAGRFSSTATANSLVAVTAAAQRSAQCTAAAATAVVEFSRGLAERTYGLGHRTSVALYRGLEEASAGVMVRFKAGQQAVKGASVATVASLGSFGSDVTDASRMLARDAPAVARRVQQDLGSAALHVHHSVRDAIVTAGTGLYHATQQVSHAAQESTNRLRTAYQGLKNPSTEWDGKAWIRFIARLGLFGAAL